MPRFGPKEGRSSTDQFTTLRGATWNARIERNDERANRALKGVCDTLLSRVGVIQDQRSREMVSDALRWASRHPAAILYNAKSTDDIDWIAPNLVGFQTVMQLIAMRILDNPGLPAEIVVDRQTQFNKTQDSLAKFYAKASGKKFDFGTGLPEIDYSGMPETPILFKSGAESPGLDLVDIYWASPAKVDIELRQAEIVAPLELFRG